MICECQSEHVRGSHEELMQLNGKYAKMFNMQINSLEGNTKEAGEPVNRDNATPLGKRKELFKRKSK